LNANTALSSTLARRRAWSSWPWFAAALKRPCALLAAWRAEAELRALDDFALHDLGLDRGGIAHAARHGRCED
jgi:uncharacterized protein YjiS (DUF1127 family)